ERFDLLRSYVWVSLRAVLHALRAMRYGLNVQPYADLNEDNDILRDVRIKGINELLITVLVHFYWRALNIKIYILYTLLLLNEYI
ncbi:hypothetical protein, partial [Clostridioides difficile]|uniref:hypothetical protein n=1 Tax=Clostridioides difficile TaxID=1496 RepID=UPI00197F4442